MGGLLLVLAGDFRQTLPIIKREMRVHRFHDVHAGQYADLLIRIEDGKIPPNPANGLIKIPCGNLVDTLEKLQKSVSPDIFQNFFDVDWLSERAILAPTNQSVQLINESLLDQIPTEEQIYLSIDHYRNRRRRSTHPIQKCICMYVCMIYIH